MTRSATILCLGVIGAGVFWLCLPKIPRSLCAYTALFRMRVEGYRREKALHPEGKIRDHSSRVWFDRADVAV